MLPARAALIAILSLLLLVACSGDDDIDGGGTPTGATPASTAPPEPTATPTPTPAAASPSPEPAIPATPEPETPSPAPTPAETPEPSPRPIPREEAELPGYVWAMIEALEAGDAETLASYVRLQEVPCIEPPLEGITAQPECEPGDPDGTTYEQFAAASCHGYFTDEPEQLLANILEGAGELYAVAVPEDSPQQEDWWPAGDYLIVSTGTGTQTHRAVGLYVEDGDLVRAASGCNPPDRLIRAGGTPLEILVGPFEP